MKCVPGCFFCLSQELTPPLCFGKFFLIFVQQYCQRRGSPFFLPPLSPSFPSPCLYSFLSYCTSTQYSQNSWTICPWKEWALLFLLPLTDQVSWLHCVFSELWIVLLSSPCCIRKRYHSSQQSFTTKLAFLVYSSCILFYFLLLLMC